MEPRLDHLCVHALTVPSRQLQPLFEHLQQTLGESSGFISLGAHGYLRPESPMATASVSAANIHLDKPDQWLPQGPDAADYRRLVSEIEMALHDHPVNKQRVQEGLQPVNSLWLWGGGELPDAGNTDLPMLFADDPLFKGYWMLVGAPKQAWTGSFESGGGVVVDGTRDPGSTLEALVAALNSRRLRQATLLFADGHGLVLGAGDRFRFWRNNGIWTHG